MARNKANKSQLYISEIDQRDDANKSIMSGYSNLQKPVIQNNRAAFVESNRSKSANLIEVYNGTQGIHEHRKSRDLEVLQQQVLSGLKSQA